MTFIKRLITIFCLASLLLSGSYVLSAPIKGSITQKDPGIKPGMAQNVFTFTQALPWPSPRANSRNTSRSLFNGPSGKGVKTKEFNLVNLKNYAGLLPDRTKFLLVGKNDMICYVDKKAREMKAVSALGNDLFSHQVRNVNVNPCYLTSGGFYDINVDRTRIDYTDYNGNEIWNKHLKPAHFQRSEEIRCVGNRIYTSTYFEGKITVQAWEKNSDFAWFMYPGDSWITGIGEDPGKFTYIQTVEGLWQHDWGFTDTWFNPSVTPENSDGAFDDFAGPIIGNDGRVWVNLPWSKKYEVYNKDGSLHKEGSYSEYHSNHIKGACVGGDGRFYVAGWFDVQCFSDWNNLEWHLEFDHSIRILDMAMGKDNTLYILYGTDGEGLHDTTYHWTSLDPADGSIIYEADIQVPQFFQAWSKGEIAIGEKNRLIILLHTGYMAIFEPPSLEIQNIPIKRHTGFGRVVR